MKANYELDLIFKMTLLSLMLMVQTHIASSFQPSNPLRCLTKKYIYTNNFRLKSSSSPKYIKKLNLYNDINNRSESEEWWWNYAKYTNNTASTNTSSKNNYNMNQDELLIQQMEQEIQSSLREKLDKQRLNKFQNSLLNPSPTSSSNNDQNNYSLNPSPSSSSSQPSNLSIALASGLSTSLFTFFILHTPIFLSAITFIVITYIANRPPEEEGIQPWDEQDILGPISRSVGRATLTSIEYSKPKVRSVAKAILTNIEEEMMVLRQRVLELEKENQELKEYIDMRVYMDENEGRYTLVELKRLAGERGLPVSGNKMQLMMRLWEGGFL